MSLPAPAPEQLEASRQLSRRVRSEIEAGDGWISFARYMELALYAPGLGYDSGGAEKFGAAGDFVTAPQISPLFGRVLARQFAEVLQETGGGILELGAGTGLLPWIMERGEPLVTGWLGLPKKAAAAFVMGFLRRDFGATGLFALGAALSPAQTLVGMVTITLFVPCIASMLMIAKEQGARVAALIVAMVVPLALLVGGLVRIALVSLGMWA